MKLFIPSIVAAVVLLGGGCMSKYQVINPDTSTWLHYITDIEDYRIAYRLPPGGMTFAAPPVSFLSLNEEEDYTTLLGVGYDYNRLSAVASPEFFLSMRVHKFAHNIESVDSMDEFVEAIIKTADERARHSINYKPSVPSEFRHVRLNNQDWLYKEGETGEGYVTHQFIDGHYFLVGVWYREALRRNTSWYQQRKELFHRIVRQIEITKRTR